MWHKFTSKQILIGIISVVLLSIIGGVSAALISSVQGHQATKQDSFQKVTEGLKPSKDATPPNSIFVTEASPEAWENIFPFVGQQQYLNTSYDGISKDATHFMTTNVNMSPENGSAMVAGSYQYPVLAVIYKNDEAAEAALENAQTDEAVTDSIQFFTKGNILYFLPAGTDQEEFLTPKALPERITAGDLKSWGMKKGQSFMYLNFGAFLDSYTATASTSKDKKAIREIAASFGVMEQTYWVGTSKNLTDWTGKFYKLDLSRVDAREALSNLGRFNKLTPNLEKPDEWEYSNRQVPRSLQDNLEERQSILGFYTLAADKNGAAGMFSSEPGSKLTVIPSNSPLQLSVKLSPNAWVGMLQGGPEEDAPRVIYVDSVLVNVQANGEASMQFDLITKAEWDKALEEWDNPTEENFEDDSFAPDDQLPVDDTPPER